MIHKMGDGEDPEKTREAMRAVFGPAQIDHQIRQAINFCWMALPKGRQNPDELEREIRRLVDRALRDFREDASAFEA